MANVILLEMSNAITMKMIVKGLMMKLIIFLILIMMLMASVQLMIVVILVMIFLVVMEMGRDIGNFDGGGGGRVGREIEILGGDKSVGGIKRRKTKHRRREVRLMSGH